MSTPYLEPKRVVVAMSGGVDSSVAAALLVEQGYEVIGLMMRLWSEPGADNTSGNAANKCCTPESMGNARYIANQLDIPFYVVDTQDVFRRKIVNFFVDGYSNGVTPNPCVECNRHIRWDFLLNKALEFGATHLATGHYAQVKYAEDHYQLWRGVDRHKDQSYVLSVMGQQQLQRALFPVGGIPKPEVRKLAEKFNLPVAKKQDSQDLCFLKDNDYRRFLRDNAPNIMDHGEIVDSSGNVLGEHLGLPNYTIGQRRGIGIAAAHPLYVIGKNAQANTLIVGPKAELGTPSLIAKRVNWVDGITPEAPFKALVQIRYKAQARPATIIPTGAHSIKVEFDEPVRDATPGQAAVVYDGDRCIAGGIIFE